MADKQKGKFIGGFRPFMPGEKRENPDGSVSSELSVTVKMPDGSFANIPSLWMTPDGPVELNDIEARQKALEFERETGRKAPRFKSLNEAVEQAIRRSGSGGASTPLFKE